MVMFSSTVLRKMRSPFLSNYVVEATAGTNTDITGVVQKRVEVVYWLISPVG